ncbi:MAG: phenylacetic acid degradation protein [Burkholderiales bacterium PBB2]|nr:MAG: phenylacetic acid degradation protein [Burkholderiales bacterium PBB2]
MSADTHARIARSFEAQGLMRTLGARLAWVGEGEVHIAMPNSPAVSQQQGFVHAGAITSIVDSACGYAALSLAAPGFEVVSAEFKINLMRPAIGTHFLAVGKVQNAGRLLTVCSGEVRAFLSEDARDFKVVALMQATMVLVQPR